MITVYTKPDCPYCEKAKIWLADKNIPFQPIDVLVEQEALSMLKRDGHKTVPQIYQGDKVLVAGGYTGLTKLTESDISALLQAA